MVTKNNFLKECHALQQFGKIPADLTKLKPLPNRFSKQTYFVFFTFNTFYILAPVNKKCQSITNFLEGRDTFYHCDSMSREKA